MTITDAIALLDRKVPNPSSGLPDELFFYISRTTPLVNVDLLIKDENGRTLLSWRNDKHVGCGWHIPGGIVRFKEKLETRIRKTAKAEIGINIKFDPTPLEINQIIVPEKTIRGHFMSILYKCLLPKEFIPKNNGLSIKDQGYLAWHKTCPKDLLKYHKIYEKYLS